MNNSTSLVVYRPPLSWRSTPTIDYQPIDDYYRDKQLVELEKLCKLGHKKWGWIIYRTTYDDDEKWARFEERFQELVRRESLDRDNGKHIHTQYLDFPVRSDIKYQNSTTAQLRTEFQEWVAGDGPLLEHDMNSDDRWKTKGAISYEYFIRVDTEAMESVLESDEGWVDLVQVDWPGDDEGDAEYNAGDDGHTPIEGITSYNVGFQRVAVEELYPFCWIDLEYIAYKVFGAVRPPAICYPAGF